jgi:hypothetical protein
LRHRRPARRICWTRAPPAQAQIQALSEQMFHFISQRQRAQSLAGKGCIRRLYIPLQAEALVTLQPPCQRTPTAARTPRKEHPPQTAPASCAKRSPAVSKQPRVLGPSRRWECSSPLASGQRARQGEEPRKEHPSTEHRGAHADRKDQTSETSPQ